MTLLKSGMEAVGFLVGKLAVLLVPLVEELPQLARSISTPRVELGIHSSLNWLDAHALAFAQRDLAIENNDAVLHVSDIRRCR